MSENKEKNPNPLTPEEVEKRKAEITKFHKEQIPFLETQLKYEGLLTEIEETMARRAIAQLRFIQAKSQLMEPMAEEPQESEKEEQPEVKMTAKRILKKEKA